MAGTAPILTGGFGIWGGAELIPTLGFGSSAVAVFVPVVHYHVLEGPPKRTHVLAGPSKQIHILQGSN